MLISLFKSEFEIQKKVKIERSIIQRVEIERVF